MTGHVPRCKSIQCAECYPAPPSDQPSDEGGTTVKTCGWCGKNGHTTDECAKRPEDSVWPSAAPPSDQPEAGDKGACWRHDQGHREYVCTCSPPVQGDTGRDPGEQLLHDIFGKQPPSSDERCHCGEPVAYGYDGDPTHHRGMCEHCDSVRCDAYPGECKRPHAPSSDTRTGDQR